MNYPGRIIKLNEPNAKIVKAIQLRLNELGCGPLQGTGTFGTKTVSAVKLFQSTHTDRLGNPLQIDGKVGSITWEILFDSGGDTGISTVPSVTTVSNNLLAEAVKIAFTQVGVMEDPPGSNKGAKVGGYLASVGLDPGYYWCAAFVYWCFNKAAENLGVKNPLIKTAGCTDHWNRTKGKKIDTAQAVNNPSLLKPGDIFIMDFGHGAGHTGIVTEVNGGFIKTIEGNSNNTGSSNGIGVFELTRKIASIKRGFIEYK